MNVEPRFRPEFVLLIGVLAVTTSSFIVLGAKSSNGHAVDRVSLAMFRVLFTSLISYGLLYKILGMNPHPKMETTGSSLLERIPSPLVVIISGISLGLHFGLWFISLDYLPVGVSLALTNSAPLFIVLLTWLFYHEKSRPLQIIGVVIGVLGTAVLSWESSYDTDIFINGTLYAFLSAIALAVYLSLAKRGIHDDGLWKYFGKVNFMAALFLFTWAMTTNGFEPTPQAVLNGLLLALIPGTIGHASFQYAMSRLKSALVSVSILGEPLLGALFAWLIYSQYLSFLQIVGIFTILFGIYLASSNK